MSGDCRILWRDRKEEGKPVQSGERGRVWLVGAARGTLLTDWGRAVSCHVGVQAVARTPLLAVLYRRENPCAVSTLHWSLRLFLSSSSSSFSPSLFSSIFQWWKGRGFHVSGISGIGEALTRAEIKCDKPVFLKGIRLYDNKTRKERLLYLLAFFSRKCRRQRGKPRRACLSLVATYRCWTERHKLGADRTPARSRPMFYQLTWQSLYLLSISLRSLGLFIYSCSTIPNLTNGWKEIEFN